MKKIINIFILLLFFSQTNFAQTAEYFDSGRNKTPDDGIQGDFHQKNIGKIVFSKQPTDKNLNESSVTTSFNVGDYIYARIYLQTCVANYKVYKTLNPIPHKNEVGGAYIKVFLDGKDAGFSIGLKDFNGTQATITQKGLTLNGEGDAAQYNSEDFINSLNDLSDGQHTYRFELWGQYDPQTAMGYDEFKTKAAIASGEFTITKKPGSGVKLGRNWAGVESLMDDPEVAAKALKVLKEYASAHGWSEDFQSMKFAQEDWDIEYNQYTSAIVDRRIILYAFAKWPNGQCTMQRFAFIQDYNGSGYQKAVKFEGIVNDSQEQLDCD
jgi:hypothetical protein